MRAAHDDEEAAISRLRSAAQVARLTAASGCSGAASMTLKDGAFVLPAPGVLPTA